jgi:hypothetical protein
VANLNFAVAEPAVSGFHKYGHEMTLPPAAIGSITMQLWWFVLPDKSAGLRWSTSAHPKRHAHTSPGSEEGSGTRTHGDFVLSGGGRKVRPRVGPAT